MVNEIVSEDIKSHSVKRSDSCTTERSQNIHPCVGTVKMSYSRYKQWSLDKIALISVQMNAIKDRRCPKYKQLAKQKRSQEDRLFKRKEEVTKRARIDLMDSAIAMLVNEVRACLPSQKQ